jgi:hypothetical protein
MHWRSLFASLATHSCCEGYAGSLAVPGRHRGSAESGRVGEQMRRRRIGVTGVVLLVVLLVARREAVGSTVRGLHLLHGTQAQRPAYLHSRDVTLGVLCQGTYAESRPYADFVENRLPWLGATHCSIGLSTVGRRSGKTHLRDGRTR